MSWVSSQCITWLAVQINSGLINIAIWYDEYKKFATRYAELIE